MTLKWFTSYLEHRLLRWGIMYQLNKISKQVSHTVVGSAIVLYADDYSLYKTGKHIQDVQINLQHNVDQVSKWFERNNMSFTL